MTEVDDDGSTTTPAEAFSLLGNDQRMAIMQQLWDQRDPMPFSALREAVGLRDSGQFNYHLGKLQGLYVRETDAGYQLTRPGRRVLAAVLAGDLLERPEIEPTRVDWPCPRCGTAVELRYDDEMLRVLCPQCPGFFQGEARTSREYRENPRGTISTLPIPAAGVKGRDPMSVLVASFRWITHQVKLWTHGMCPECTGKVDLDVQVCPEHAVGDGLCETCGSFYAGLVDATCETCGDGVSGLLVFAAWSDPAMLGFFADHGFDLGYPDAETSRAALVFEEVVRSVEPLDYEARWTVDDETLVVGIDGDAGIVSTERVSN